MPGARNIKPNKAISAFRELELNENTKLHMFCNTFGWIFYIALVLLVCAFLFLSSIMEVLLVFILSPLTVTVNYI